MIARAPIRQRGPRSLFTPMRITTAILVGLVCLSLLPAAGRSGWLIGYLLLVLVTCIALRSTRHAPGSWLGRRGVRRALVVLIAATCLALMATPATTGPASTPSGGLPVLFLFLVVLNVALGGATQRVAAAPDTSVDERQEALRNRAHRVAYPIFAVLVGGTAVVADVASSQTRSWLGSSLVGGGAWIVFLELLFVLPAMAMAFLEPGSPPPDVRELRAGRPRNRPLRLATALLALTFALPVVLSVAVTALPMRTSATVQASTGGPDSGAIACREFYAESAVGVGVEADIPLHARACWNGRRAFESYGMNESDCRISSSMLTTITTTRCARTIAADGTLTFTYGADVASSLIPFLHRQVTLRLVLDRNGAVKQFP